MSSLTADAFGVVIELEEGQIRQEALGRIRTPSVVDNPNVPGPPGGGPPGAGDAIGAVGVMRGGPINSLQIATGFITAMELRDHLETLDEFLEVVADALDNDLQSLSDQFERDLRFLEAFHAGDREAFLEEYAELIEQYVSDVNNRIAQATNFVRGGRLAYPTEINPFQDVFGDGQPATGYRDGPPIEHEPTPQPIPGQDGDSGSDDDRHDISFGPSSSGFSGSISPGPGQPGSGGHGGSSRGGTGGPGPTPTAGSTPPTAPPTPGGGGGSSPQTPGPSSPPTPRGTPTQPSQPSPGSPPSPASPPPPAPSPTGPKPGPKPDPKPDPAGGPSVPVLLDLDGNGISVTELSQSTHFVDGGDGLGHRTAWAGAGDGVLFFDADGSGDISEEREYVFTEWDPTAGSDLDALRSRFDTNGDGKLTSADDDWADFKVQVVKDDGTTEVKTLDQLGITEIDLTGDAANIELPDGSVITGQTTFTMNGQTHTVAEMSLATDGRGYRLEEVETTDGSGNTVRDITGYDATGEVAWAIHVVAAPDGSNTVNSYDDNGDGVYDRVQVITVATVSGDEVRTVSNYTGSDAATGVLENQTA